MVGPSGIEPETFRLSIECSKPIELRPYINWSLQFYWTLEVMLLVMRALTRAPAGVNWIPVGQSSAAAIELPLIRQAYACSSYWKFGGRGGS